MKLQIKLFLICLLIFGIFSVGECANKQVVLILWHGLELEEAQSWEFGQPVAWALLNTRSGGAANATGAYLSLGAGARAVGHVNAAKFRGDQRALELYRLHTGLVPGVIVQPDIALIYQAQKVNYEVLPGALGTAILEADKSIRVLGNSDGAEMTRWAATVGMDSFGRVELGNISQDLLLEDPNYPYGMKTNYGSLLQQVLVAEEELVVVDLGDPYRYDNYENYLLSEQQKQVYSRMVLEAKSFLEKLVESRKEDTILVILSPYPSRKLAEKGSWLTPIIQVGLSDGLLFSGTTRWPGLITNMDVAPSILEILHIEHNQPFIGRHTSIVHEENSGEKLVKMQDKILAVSEKRGFVLRLIIIIQVILYAAVLLVIILRKSLFRIEYKLLSMFLEVFLFLPLAMLLWSKLKWVVALLFLLLLFSQFWSASLFKIATIGIITCFAIVVDLLTGSWLMRYSYLGYDPLGGARFYGLGNEFMGVLIGASIISFAILGEKINIDKKWKLLLGLFFFGIILIATGAPALGTNVGGAITAVFGFGITLLLFRGKKITWSSVLILILIMGLVLGTLMIIDHQNPGEEQSHIGQTVALLRRDGIKALQMIIVRKLAMNLKLMRHSLWSRALLVALVSMGASFIWPSKFIAWLKQNHPLVAKGLIGVVIGSLTAFIFNDSGVVAAATCLYFGATTLLLLALSLKHDAASS